MDQASITAAPIGSCTHVDQSRVAAIFAPKLAKAQTKAVNSANGIAHERWTPVAHRSGHGSAELRRVLCRGMSNQAMLRLLAQPGRSLTGNQRGDQFEQKIDQGIRQAAGASRDFSRIPISPAPGTSWYFGSDRVLAAKDPVQHLSPSGTSLGRKAGCACGGECPRCRRQARLGVAATDLLMLRPAGTDDLTETDLTVPRAEGDAGVPAPADAGVPGGAPSPSCCDQAFAKGLAASDYGGVICCKNVKHSCVWPSNMSSALTNARARSISIDCARVHEDTHHDDIDCTGAEVERPGFKAGKNARAEECIAYRAEVACFDAHLTDCSGDAACESQIRARRITKQGQADANCA
jgi:hypothetical protein